MKLSIGQLTAEDIGLIFNRRTRRMELFDEGNIPDYLPQTKWTAKRYHEYLFISKRPIMAYYLTLKACVRHYENEGTKRNEHQ